MIDEAGKASTAELDTVISLALTRGRAFASSVMTINWPRYRHGVLRDPAAHHHNTPDARRSSVSGTPSVAGAEAAASLALRSGDPAGIAFYLDHQRVHVGADALAADMAYQAWRTDLAAGRDSVPLAPHQRARHGT